MYNFITASYCFINASEYFLYPYLDVFLFFFKSSKHLIKVKCELIM